MKIGDTITTPHGTGTIVAFENFRLTRRVGVKLDHNPFSFPVAYYFEKDINNAK